jgi:hypothetical protein
MNELTEKEIVKRIISDKGALKDLIYHIVSDPEVRMAVISAVLTGVATKQDVRDLRQEMNQLRTEIDGLRREINDMRRGMKSLIRWTITAILIVWGSTVLPVMMRLAGII